MSNQDSFRSLLRDLGMHFDEQIADNDAYMVHIPENAKNAVILRTFFELL